MRQAVLASFLLEEGALILQQRRLCKQAGCDEAKGIEEHSLEVKVHAEYNKSLCSIVDRNVYC